jgi:hypothetical protein
MGGNNECDEKHAHCEREDLITISRHQISLKLSDPSPKISDTKEAIAEWTLQFEFNFAIPVLLGKSHCEESSELLISNVLYHHNT